jgi:4-hydroxybenzoate polyprenyltransferase
MNSGGSGAETREPAALGSHAAADGTVGPEPVALASVSDRLEGLLRSARPQQWVKNLTCFAGLIFSGRLFLTHAIAQACLAFAGFCLASAGVYLWNDVYDRPFDRLNPKKRERPIASGLVPVSWALTAAVVLMAGALASALLLAPLCPAVLACYLGLSIAYSVRLKHTVLLDVNIIALGFVLRVLYGVYAIEVQPTSWIVLCMFFLALLLGFAKRRGELHLMGDDEPHRRPVLGKYRVGYLDILLAMTATMAILCYALYTVTGRHHNATLVVTVPLVTYGITRYMLLVMVHGEGDAPERLLVSDRVLLATVAAWVLLCIVVLYGKLDMFLE